MPTPASHFDMLGYVPLTQFIEKVATGIPKVLPAKFYETSPGAKVVGNKAKNFAYNGTRKTAKIQNYGSEPRRVNMAALSGEEFQLLHATETLRANQEFLLLLAQMKENVMFSAEKVQDELNRQGIQFATRFTNLRTAAIQSLIANGKIWFDSTGALLASSSGADVTIDYGIPAGNLGQIGGIISVGWSNAAATIHDNIVKICLYLRQLTGYKPKYAIYGKNIPGYFTKNTELNGYLARNSMFRDTLISTGQIPSGMFDLEWIPGFDSFFETEAGVITEQFGGDTIVIFPELTDQIYSLYEGSMFVPKSIQPVESFEAAINNVDMVFGMGRFCAPQLNPLAFDFTMFDTFLPRWNNPSAVAIVDVTP